ncbi:hypothetical protein PAXRUDRAFT_831212 [Paxillus rubicundulus Ve08.2h10]|uniref:Uncharacterized protein n=1 Tax=Paxillus rubicundulus Ve08.2h10 TaxID=930991 RepID=A0A0D0D3H0_9AGAM|nr:hypothetical protein PAXRUDRAFT_831212 [Paxillus rubicundulus Ve08.2h10]
MATSSCLMRSIMQALVSAAIQMFVNVSVLPPQESAEAPYSTRHVIPPSSNTTSYPPPHTTQTM